MTNLSADTQPTNVPRTSLPNEKAACPQLYHVIIHCRDEAQQRDLFDRLRREGLRCRLTVL